MRNWLSCVLVVTTVSACGSSSTQGLFSGSSSATGTGGFANVAGATFGGSGGTTVFGESGGVTSSGGSSGFPMTGGATFGGSGGIPIFFDSGVAGFGTGGFTSTGGSPETGGVGSPDAGGSGGSSPIDASADSPLECPVAQFSGTLSGPYTAALGSTTFRANLSFKVDASGAITGTLTSTSDATSRAKLTGTMNCSNGETSISIVEGSYRNILGTTAYEGTMTATLVSGAFTGGTWTITEPSSSGSGQGTWSAK